MKEKRAMLTVNEVAELKGVDARTVRGWIQRGLIEAEQINPRLWLVPVDSVKEFQPPTAGRPLKSKSSTGSKRGHKKQERESSNIVS